LYLNKAKKLIYYFNAVAAGGYFSGQWFSSVEVIIFVLNLKN
jgi:hypothetical protein